MSARGARSRKVQQKDIQKKEKKVVDKGKAPQTLHEPSHDAFADWRTSTALGLSRSITVSSRGTSRSGGTNDSSSRPRLNTLPLSDAEVRKNRPPKSSGGTSATVSDISSNGKDKTKFEAKGKESRAPRGRGGGVPIKKPVAPSPIPRTFRTDSAASYPLANQKSWMNFKVWEGGKDGMRPYGGFNFDEDMQTGTVLIFFKEEQIDEDRPIPSIRAELEVLENSGSTWLTNALQYGRIEDTDVDEWTLPTSSESPLSLHFAPHSSHLGSRKMLGPTSLGGRSPPPLDIDQGYAGMDSRAASRLQNFRDSSPSNHTNSSSPFRRNNARNPTHEIWFTAPNSIRTPQGQRLHHVAIRNFLAMLHGKPIVGSDLFEMLYTLQSEIQIMYDLDSNDQSRVTPQERSTQMITNYLGQHGLDDVRNNTRQALGLLAWSEQDNIRWRQGYHESFVHLAGAITPQVEDLPEFKRLSAVTRRNLGLAAKTLQLRVMEAEEKLAAFDFSEFWGDTSKSAHSPVYQSYQSFGRFLTSHYTRIYGNWPPGSQSTWLNRKVVLALQEDFGSLYDYLVNRDVVWNPREERASRKWEMAHRKIDVFDADLPELNITDMLVTFDAKNGYAHIPYPYPLLPREVPKPNKEKDKKGFFDRIKKDKSKEAAIDAKASLQLSIVFSDATNIEKQDVNFNGSTLVDRFEQFELTTDVKHVTPREARLGRWILLYGVLQVLSALSVDTQGLKYTDGVRNLLCTDLKRCPEWVTNGQAEYLEASQHRSWCWQRSWDPTPIQTAPVELEALPTIDRHDPNRESAYPYQSLPSPPPDRSLPPPPFDNTTLLQNDMRRLGEKIDAFSLSHNASHTFRQELERRRENEKVMQKDFHDRKLQTSAQLQTPFTHLAPPPMTHKHTSQHPPPRPPRDDSLHHFPDSSPGSSPNLNLNSSFDSRSLGAPHSLSRVTSANTDLGAYPFSSNEPAWPVPPGYEYKPEAGKGNRDSTVLGSMYEKMQFAEGEGRGRERGGWV